MVVVSEGCWFDFSISVCMVDYFFIVFFYLIIVGNKFCLYSFISSNYF